VTQHLDRIWTLNCFNNSHGFRRAFDIIPLGLVSLSNYLSNHMWIIENEVRTRPEWPIQGKLVLEAEADSKSCWTGPPASIGCLGWSLLPPPLPLSTSWPSPMFLTNITSLCRNLFSKVWKGPLKNELTSKLSCHLRARVIGPCIIDGGIVGAPERVMSSSVGIDSSHRLSRIVITWLSSRNVETPNETWWLWWC
jgi:hypothetical protein